MNLQLIALFAAPLTALIALGYGGFLSQKVLAADPGGPNLRKIASAVKTGAMTYLQKQFSVVIPIMILLSVVIYFGLWIAVHANVRTANAAQKGLNPALKVAFGAGTVNGMLVVGLGLLGVSLIYLWSYFTQRAFGDAAIAKHATDVLVGYGFGAALLALFMRVGGGIFTKAADVGADLVGKIEAGIPEDDPRNPAVI